MGRISIWRNPDRRFENHPVFLSAERLMDAGAVPFIFHKKTRVIIRPECMHEMGLTLGQTIKSANVMLKIYKWHHAYCEMRLLDEAATVDAPRAPVAD